MEHFADIRRSRIINKESSFDDCEGGGSWAFYELKVTHHFSWNDYQINFNDCLVDGRHYKEVFVTNLGGDYIFGQFMDAYTDYLCTSDNFREYPKLWTNRQAMLDTVAADYIDNEISDDLFEENAIEDIAAIMYEMLPEFVASKAYRFTQKETKMFAEQRAAFLPELQKMQQDRELWNDSLPQMMTQAALKGLRRDLQSVIEERASREVCGFAKNLGLTPSIIIAWRRHNFIGGRAIRDEFHKSAGAEADVPVRFSDSYLSWMTELCRQGDLALTDRELADSFVRYMKMDSESLPVGL